MKGKKVLVFGLGRSGVGAANLLSRYGAEVGITDKKPREELGEFIAGLSFPAKLYLGGYPQGLNGTDLIVVSPGVPLDIEPLLRSREKGIKIIGEIELAYRMLDNRAPFLVVTGSNGKSTTTTLLDAMLRKGGFKTLLGGNIGNALTEEILKTVDSRQSIVNSRQATNHNYSSVESQKTSDYRLSTIDYIVVEVSSFQLESIDEFKPKGASILNITPDHMDRYRSMAEYADAKAAVFRNQDEEDFLVLNADDPETIKVVSERLKARAKTPEVFYFSRKKKVEGAYYRDGVVYFNIPGVPSTFNLQPSTFKIKGVHNLENAMASAAMALLAGCRPEAVEEALREFPGLEHRLEFVREVDGVRYINDSKGTNVGAVVKSLEGFPEPILLIAGGRDKEGDFGELRPLIKEKVKALILIGEASEKIKRALGDLTATVLAPDMEAAVGRAKEMAKKGDVVLLSPACASFDMFRDFEDRGRRFKKIVMELT